MQLFHAHTENNPQMHLDTGLTMNLCRHKEIVTNCCKAEQALEMTTNAGTKVINEEGDVPGQGPTWFDKKAVIIFSLSLH